MAGVHTKQFFPSASAAACGIAGAPCLTEATRCIYIGLDVLTRHRIIRKLRKLRGVSLQLSGYKHLGQFILWSSMLRRIYRQFVHGLSRIGKMQVFTSSGAGTWGPPLRLGSNPEIVVLHFE